ncbi:HAD family hydrolase [Streptomyces sp. NPDC052236]|uniref:HAD family hydrolase n=1 Tax=Streptomyces sp. NPDC052236 TaxID=3365686 RepID=UPI0037CFF193
MAEAPSHDSYHGVIFDLDGVIVDTEHLWEESWAAYCAGHGTAWTREDTATVQGMSAPEWAAHIAALLGDPHSADQVNGACVGYVVNAVAAGRGPLMTGARELVLAVSDLVPVAVASSAARRVIDAVLTHHGLAEVLATTVSSEEVPHGKPSPDVYAEAARRIGVAAGRAVAVEDSGNGVRAAHAAGLHVVAIPNRVYPPSPAALGLADHIAADHAAARACVLGHIVTGGAR